MQADKISLPYNIAFFGGFFTVLMAIIEIAKNSYMDGVLLLCNFTLMWSICLIFSLLIVIFLNKLNEKLADQIEVQIEKFVY